MLRRTWVCAMLGLVLIAVAAGCGGEADRVVVRLTDPEGAVGPREITVAYVNERLDRMPPHLVPDTPGDEGKRAFVDEIIQKELLVILGHRLGVQNEPDLEYVLALYEDDQAEKMYVQEMVYDPAEPSEEDVQNYNVLRETAVELLQIVVNGEEVAWEVYRRITEGGEDFEDVAREVSIANSASDGGKMSSRVWTDLHPVVGMYVWDAEAGDIIEPVQIGGPYHIYKIIGKKAPPKQEPLEGQRLGGITAECRMSRRTRREYELNAETKAEADVEYNDEALNLVAERLGDELKKVIPENVAELSRDERMELARIPLIPQLTEEESEMELVSYTVAGQDKVWTLGDFRDIIEETPGMEGPKTDDPYGLMLFIWRTVRQELVDDEIERRGYRGTQEMADYLEQRREEFIVNVAYEREVNQKVEEPGGQEVRDYFRSHREDYTEPPKVDLRQLIAATEAEANLIYQRLTGGDATFEDMVETYSIDEWSKPRGGLIEDYFQGERRLSYLQGIVFDLEIGEISKPFQAPGGYAIVEVLATYPERRHEFSEVGDVVLNNMITERKENRLEAVLAELRASVEIEWNDENLAYVTDMAEAREGKHTQRVVTTP